MSNEYGLDYKYFDRKLGAIINANGFKYYTPSEAAREFLRLAMTSDSNVILEKEFTGELQAGRDHLQRVLTETQQLWQPVDDFVRPLTPLGHSVCDKALELIKDRKEITYTSALNFYDCLLDEDKVNFKEYVINTWPNLNPLYPPQAAIPESIRSLIADAVNPDAGFIWKKEGESRCTACGSGARYDQNEIYHEEQCSYAKQKAALSTLRELLSAAPSPVEPLVNWQPIETLPADQSYRLVYCGGSECVGLAFKNYLGDICVAEPQAISHNSLTHWMPLPPPPVSQEKGNE